MLELSSERHRAWLAAISRADLTKEKLPNVYVCGCHFVQSLLIICYCVQDFYLEEPAYIMKKSDIDWFSCLSPGHDKVNITSLQAASERATTRTEQRRKRMEETSACSASRSVEVEASVNKETTTSLDTCNFCSQEVQTDSEMHHKTVQTKVIELCTREVQTECNDFFLKVTF